ncbi:MAG: iron-sulfur cluster co-chaperone HscB C-terminal domain-containing protein [Phycisphaerales bacterium JB047]
MSAMHGSNPFETLGLMPGYAIDRDQVERAYRARIAEAHPDAGSEAIGLDPAAFNQARAILLDDEQRANALLAMLGGPDASACKELPDGFLMDMMMQRQEIEEAIESGGDAQRDHWEQWGLDQRATYRQELTEQFGALGEHPNEDQLRAIRVQLNAWRYIERLIEQLDPEYDPAQADFH